MIVEINGVALNRGTDSTGSEIPQKIVNPAGAKDTKQSTGGDMGTVVNLYARAHMPQTYTDGPFTPTPLALMGL
jgi:hypothetical protein